METTPQPVTTMTTSQSAPGAAKQGFDFMGLLPLGMIFLVFYFLVFRPQQQKVKQQKSMMEALQRGDKVITESGLMGTIVKFEGDAEVHVEIAPGVVVRMLKGSVGSVIAKPGAPQSEKTADIKQLPRKKTTKK